MPKTTVRENESLDEALRRFKRQVNKAGTLAEARKLEAYLKPGLRRTFLLLLKSRFLISLVLK